MAWNERPPHQARVLQQERCNAEERIREDLSNTTAELKQGRAQSQQSH